MIITRNVDWYLSYIYFYIFMVPWYFYKIQMPSLSFILLVWTVIKYKKEILINIKDTIKFIPLSLLILFILYTYISSLWSNPISEGFFHVHTFQKYYLLLIPVILISLSRKNAITSIKVITVSFGFYAIYSIFIYLNIILIEGSSISNPRGHLRYLIVSQYMVIAIFLASIFTYYAQIRKEKILFFSISLLSLFALFINNSRTAQISFFMILLIFLIIFLLKRVLSLKLLLVFTVVTMFSINLLYDNNKLNRFKHAYNETIEVFEDVKYNGSTGLRLYFNKVGFEILKENFFFGSGPKDNRIILQEIQKKDQNYNSRILNHFHSEHMDTLTAYGIIGYSLLFLSIVLLIYSLRKQDIYFYMSLAVFLTLFFNSFANKTLSVKPLNYVYFLFFLFFTIIALKDRKTK